MFSTLIKLHFEEQWKRQNQISALSFEEQERSFWPIQKSKKNKIKDVRFFFFSLPFYGNIKCRILYTLIHIYIHGTPSFHITQIVIICNIQHFDSVLCVSQCVVIWKCLLYIKHNFFYLFRWQLRKAINFHFIFRNTFRELKFVHFWIYI